MKLRIFFVFFAILGIAGMFCAGNPPADVKEMKITSSSKQALQAFYEGRSLFDIQEYQKSVDFFTKAIELDDKFALAYLYKAWVGGQKEFNVYSDKALKLIDNVSEGEKCFLKMYEFQRNRDGANMVKEADRLQELYPDDYRLLFYLASDIYWDEDDKAIGLFEMAILKNPEFAPIYRNLGYKYSILRDFKNAEKNYIKYKELLPEKVSPIRYIATLYRQKGDFDKALASYNEILEMEPNNSARLMVGHCYVFKNKFADARLNYMKWFNTTKDFGSKNYALFYNAVSFIYEDDFNAALQGFEKLRSFCQTEKLYKQEINTCLNQAWLSYNTGKIEEGNGYLKTAETLTENSGLTNVEKDVYRYRLMSWNAYKYIKQGEFDQAETLLKEFELKLKERNMPGAKKQLSFLLGLFDFYKGNYKNAIVKMENGIGSPYEWYFLGLAYEKLNDQSKAQEYFKQVAGWYLNSLELALVRNKALKKIN